jgi:hypothetical protein
MTKAVRAEQHVLRKVAEPVKPAVIDDEGPGSAPTLTTRR